MKKERLTLARIRQRSEEAKEYAPWPCGDCPGIQEIKFLLQEVERLREEGKAAKVAWYDMREEANRLREAIESHLNFLDGKYTHVSETKALAVLRAALEGEAVTRRSAKPPCAGSIPAVPSPVSPSPDA